MTVTNRSEAKKRSRGELTMLRCRLLSLVNNREVTRGGFISKSSKRHTEPQVTQTKIFKISKTCRAVLTCNSIQISKTPSTFKSPLL